MHSGVDAGGEGKRVLYVDDEEALALLAADLLSDGATQVVCAYSGAQALDIYQQRAGQFDLVVTDESMPGMTGIELAQKLFLIAPELPVILCSGHLLSMHEEGIAQTNIKDILAKTDVYCKLPQVIERIFRSQS